MLALIGVALFIPPVRDRVQDIFWFSLKVAFSMYMYIWYRGTFPRYRFDQLMKVGWKILLPLGIGVLILTAIGNFFSCGRIVQFADDGIGRHKCNR